MSNSPESRPAAMFIQACINGVVGVILYSEYIDYGRNQLRMGSYAKKLCYSSLSGYFRAHETSIGVLLDWDLGEKSYEELTGWWVKITLDLHNRHGKLRIAAARHSTKEGLIRLEQMGCQKSMWDWMREGFVPQLRSLIPEVKPSQLNIWRSSKIERPTNVRFNDRHPSVDRPNQERPWYLNLIELYNVASNDCIRNVL